MRSAPKYCECSAHARSSRPPTYESATEDPMDIDGESGIAGEHALDKARALDAMRQAAEEERRLEQQRINYGELSPGEALVRFKSRFAEPRRSPADKARETRRRSDSDSTCSITSAQNVACTQVQMMGWRRDVLHAPFPPSLLPLNRPYSCNDETQYRRVDTFQAWINQPPVTEVRVGHAVERQHWYLISRASHRLGSC